ncbi:hypothetical protein MFUM_1020130 [Methylacidiphilum fumariolicum SolV]|uniref:Uncharacterized protein n=2 Tax=Candidatus Methylacidiphilum fumarolicum TaxID=591154 RepID=I0JVY4_METFB|nr:conserved protein of unknown function [Candidatus Methylacidiphilum fumarolicum]CCG91403.1 hypothetical protein MFUM_1020130 [Methylacidiphilum fumariolicum SolV]
MQNFFSKEKAIIKSQILSLGKRITLSTTIPVVLFLKTHSGHAYA